MMMREIEKIRIELNDTWVDVRVDLRSLRLALGLLPHDLFREGIFNEYVHHETVGADVEDTDHGAGQPEPPPPLLALTAPSPNTNAGELEEV